MFNARTRLPRCRPTSMCRRDQSRTFGNTFISRMTVSTRIGLGPCVTSAPTSLLLLPVRPQPCGTTLCAFTPSKSPQGPSSNLRWTVNFPPQPNDLFAPSRPQSDIWKYFNLKRDNKDCKIRAVCNDCHRSLAFTGTTSTMWRHIQRVHSIDDKPKRFWQPCWTIN